MIIKKRLNNNVVYATEGKQSMVVFGKGIGFQVHPGEAIDTALVEKVFFPTEDMNLSQIALALGNVSSEVIQISDEIIEMGAKILGKEISSKALFPLMDHIDFALKRHQDGIVIVSPIQWEVKKFYPKEVKAGQMALSHIKERMGIELAEAEGVFIALHFVNAQFDKESLATTIEFTEILRSLIQIVKFHFQVDLDEESFVYNRFLTHLRYYLMRQMSNEQIEDMNHELHDTIMNKFPKEVECMNKIAEYLYKRYGWETSNEEKMYLVLHINCLTMRTRKSV